MPTYGYRCTVCSHEFERVQKMSDPRITECEECNGLVKKIIYPVGIAFKGDGFYINDSKKETPKAKSTEAKPAEAKTEAVATETKTETVKTEATPAPAETKAKTETKPTAS
jgi:putative FmdB family regulatory protein